MNGKFLSGVLSGAVLVVLAFVLGSALFPVEASRSSAAIAPKPAEEPPAEPVTADTKAGTDTGPALDPAPPDDAATPAAVPA